MHESSAASAAALYIDAVQSNRTAAQATVIACAQHAALVGRKLARTISDEEAGTLGSDNLDAQVHEHLQQAIHSQEPTRVTLTHEGTEVDIFIDVTSPPPRLLIVGAVHMAIALVTFGNTLGFETIVLDNRTAFATEDRVGHAARIVHQWPADVLAELALDDGCYIVFLTHDPKIDNPALTVALRSPARYIGALGSRKTHARRLASLHEDGLTEAETARIHAPIGLSIGARSPEEIALAIIAEITAVRRGKLS